MIRKLPSFILKYRESIFYGLCGIVTALTLASCHDDIIGDDRNPAERDSFEGSATELILGPEAAGFNSADFSLVLAAPDGSQIRRSCSHKRLGKELHISLVSGLADGEYRLLYFDYPTAENSNLAELASDFPSSEFGLGSRIEVKDGAIRVLDHFDEEMGLPGLGTAEEPYEISSYTSLIKLAQIINSDERNGLVTKDTHFHQSVPIDMYRASQEVDRRYGWLPIGANSALPFRGHYHGDGISKLVIDRPNSAAIGLFGYANDAAIYDVTLNGSAIKGNFAVGGILGATLQSGSDRGIVALTNCSVSQSEISGSDQSVSVGALVGAVDMQSRAVIQYCNSTDNEISATYNAGGLVGGAGLYSAISFASCNNSSKVTADFSGAGGLIGSCDTIKVAASSNSGTISGAGKYSPNDTKNSGIGAGGLAGGVGTATITSCYNTGGVKAYAGVGGLVGSSRVKGGGSEAYMYNNVMFRYSYNEGDVSGSECIGGLVGEAQCGTYAVYNKGTVTGTNYVGGIAGATSIAVTHNAVNTGKVSGRDYVAGIVAKTTFGSLAINHNYGEITASGSHLGGIAGLAGNNTVIHYCGNFGSLHSTGSGPVGGIVGEIGDPREWTAMNVTECVIGGMECVMGVVGPVMAVAGEAIEAISETLEVVLHVTEVLTDSGLLVTDTVLWTMGVTEMITETEEEEIASTLSSEVNQINTEIKSKMEDIRHNSPMPATNFDPTTLRRDYPSKVNQLLSYYESEGGDVKFNEQINLAREERAHYLERVHKTNEIVHTVISGVCIVVGAVATIGGLVATGGAAAPFVIAGAAASLAGGLNALTKTCMEFEENAVLISQCINAGPIYSSSDKTGGLIGVLQDNSILRDCLNIGDGPGRGLPFAGISGDNTIEQRLISLSKYTSWDEYATKSFEGAVIWNPSASDVDINTMWNNLDIQLVKTNAEIQNPKTYSSLDAAWKISGADALWNLGNDNPTTFPIPARSEMKK